MEKFLKWFKGLRYRYRLSLVFLFVAILSFIISPWLVYLICAVLSHKLIKRKWLRNTLVIFFSFCSVIYFVSLFESDTAKQVPKNNSVNNTEITNESAVGDLEALETTPAISLDKSQNKSGDKIQKSDPAKTIVSEDYVDSIDTSEESEEDGFWEEENSTEDLFEVVKVVDGDTLDVSIDGLIKRLRLIGINTPETVDPRKPVECFGVEASNKAKSLLLNKKVTLEIDSSQGDLDKYGRLLRYVYLEDGTSFNLLMIRNGYAYEYTYNTPYKYQAEFKNAQKLAREESNGLWGDVCNGETESVNITPVSGGGNSCDIKGNISVNGEKIYHMIGCGSYSKTVIDESKGEAWFCSEEDAQSAGWRKALNC